MPYVSAHFTKGTDIQGNETVDRFVMAVDDQGIEWSIPDPYQDCQVGDWLRYIENGGTIDPAPEPKPET